MVNQQINDSEFSECLGNKAIRALDKMAIAPIPTYYEIWYSHLEQKNKNLSTDIERGLASDNGINEDFLQEIHDKYFAENQPIKNIEHYATKILTEANSLQAIAGSFNSSAQTFKSNLEELPAKLEDSSDDGFDIRAVISALYSATQTALIRNAQLEENLNSASTQIEALKDSIQEVAENADTDHLTQLKNRRYFDNKITQLTSAALENDKPLCLIVADIDHFKKFNDKWGHQVGDQVLKLVASTLRDNVKGQDIVARYGGEEFVVALPDTTLLNAKKLADTIRIAVSKRKLIKKGTGDVLGTITMSFGVATFDKNITVEGLFKKADTALYAAKEYGRNRVMVSPQT